jgi:uncharacterized protein (DUF2132 family)
MRKAPGLFADNRTFLYPSLALLDDSQQKPDFTMAAHISKDPLHGVTLEMQVNALVARYGWIQLGKLININCFKSDPSVKSSLKFLRRTPWARAEVEALYLDSLDDAAPEESDPLHDDPWANSRLKKS